MSIFPDSHHGVGPGTGTSAEIWINKTADFGMQQQQQQKKKIDQLINKYDLFSSYKSFYSCKWVSISMSFNIQF